MSLRGAPLLYVFYETPFLERQREFLEEVVGLPVIENQFHPPHERHGLVKYDGGRIILSLNLSVERVFQREQSDDLVTVIATDRAEEIADRLSSDDFARPVARSDVFTDACGHHYAFQSSSSTAASRRGSAGIDVPELRLTVGTLESATSFYRDILDLELLERTDRTARFATGTVDLVLEQGRTSPDGRPIRSDTYLLVVYTGAIHTAREELVRRGLVFKSKGIGVSDIGGTARFVDPWGHAYCLYEPSEESLTWGSGSKVKDLASSVGSRR